MFEKASQTMENNAKKIFVTLAFFITAYLLATGIFLGDSYFSPDSWAYFELSKTIFSDHFYEPNTLRGYVENIKSSSFPFGYPAFLASVNFIFGEVPQNAVFINVFLSLCVMILVYKICLKLGAKKQNAIFLSFFFVAFAPFLDEVFSGRSIPFAVFLFLSGVLFCLHRSFFFGGVFFGLSALVRFDYLVFGILAIIYTIYINRKKLESVRLILGFLLGASPWIIFSLMFFGTFWMSDNSWVVRASYNAFVVDYPAIAIKTIFSHPTEWIYKICKNLIIVLKAISKFLCSNILLSAILICCVLEYKKLIRLDKILPLILFASLTPYILSGYTDYRYFSLLFFVIASLVFLTLQNTNTIKYLQIAVALSLIANLSNFVFYSYKSIKTKQDQQAERIYIDELRKSVDSNTTLIFENHLLGAKYGALSGGLSAFLPSNFKKMSEQEKAEYFKNMSPYKMIKAQE